MPLLMNVTLEFRTSGAGAQVPAMLDMFCRKGIINCGRERKIRLWDEGEFSPYPPGYQGR